MRLSATWIVLASLAAAGCRSHPSLWDRDLYLCCNMFFSQRGFASDANYLEGVLTVGEFKASDAIMLPAGTRVRVIADRERKVKFRADALDRWFVLAFRFGRDNLAPAEYFRRVFRDDDPWIGERDVWPDVRDAIHRAQIVRGMTRGQVLIARGYPPAHRTPDLTAGEWLYFADMHVLHRVTFEGETVASVAVEEPKKSASK